MPIAMAQMRHVRFRKATKSVNWDSAVCGASILTGEYREAAVEGSFFGASGASMRTGVSGAGTVGEVACVSFEDTGSWSFVASISLSTFRAVLPSSRSGATVALIFGIWSHTVTLFQRTLAHGR